MWYIYDDCGVPNVTIVSLLHNDNSDLANLLPGLSSYSTLGLTTVHTLYILVEQVCPAIQIKTIQTFQLLYPRQHTFDQYYTYPDL